MPRKSADSSKFFLKTREIRKALLERGWRDADLSRAISISTASLSQLMTHKSSASPKTIQKICEVLNKAPEEVVEGLEPDAVPGTRGDTIFPTGTPRVTVDQAGAPGAPNNVSPESMMRVWERFMSEGINGGISIEAGSIQPLELGARPTLADWAAEDPDTFIVVVRGPSMLPVFLPGDSIIVSPNRKPQNGDYVLVKIGRRIYLKQYFSYRRGDLTVFRSLFPYFPEYVLNGDATPARYEIMGVIVDLIRHFVR